MQQKIASEISMLFIFSLFLIILALSILYLGYSVKYFIHSVALHRTVFECTNVFCVNSTFCCISEVWDALLIVTAEESLTAAEYQTSCRIVLM